MMESSEPGLSAARPADESTRTTRRTRRGGPPEDRARESSLDGACTDVIADIACVYRTHAMERDDSRGCTGRIDSSWSIDSK